MVHKCVSGHHHSPNVASVFIHGLSAHFEARSIIGMKYFVLPWKHTQMYIFDVWTVSEERCLNYEI